MTMRATFAQAFRDAPMGVLRNAAFAQEGDVFRNDAALFHDFTRAARWEIHARVVITPTPEDAHDGR